MRQPSEKRNQILNVDLRTVIGRQSARLRDDLIAHCGGKPNAVQCALIQRALQLSIRISAMDDQWASDGGSMSHHSGGVYLAWSNAYARTLISLGIKAAPAPVQTLADKQRDIAARKAQAAEDAAKHAPAPPLPGQTANAARTPSSVADELHPRVEGV
jgi:hypothetical protein